MPLPGRSDFEWAYNRQLDALRNQLQGTTQDKEAQDIRNAIQAVTSGYQNVVNQIEQYGLWNDPAAITAFQRAMQGGDVDTIKANFDIALQQIGQSNQLAQQTRQLDQFSRQAETQAFGGVGLNLEQALTSTGGDLGALNRFFSRQQAETFNTQLAPTIRMALGSRGLQDSGARVELESKALGELEQAKQQNLLQAALGARANIQGIQRSDILGNIGTAQQNLANLQQSRQYQQTLAFQRELEGRRESLARELARYGGGGNDGLLGALGGAFGGGMAGFAMSGGNPWGAALGAGLGGTSGYFSQPFGQMLGSAGPFFQRR